MVLSPRTGSTPPQPRERYDIDRLDRTSIDWCGDLQRSVFFLGIWGGASAEATEDASRTPSERSPFFHGFVLSWPRRPPPANGATSLPRACLHLFPFYRPTQQ